MIIVSGLATFDDTALFANAGCIIENIQLSAWDMGLGSVFTGRQERHFRKAKNF